MITEQQTRTVKYLYKATATMPGEILALKISVNRYQIIEINLILPSRSNELDKLEVIAENATMSLKKILDNYERVKFNTDKILIITDVVLIPEDFILEVQRDYYPDELRWSLPLPDYKLELLKKGIPVTATINQHVQKMGTTTTEIRITRSRENK